MGEGEGGERMHNLLKLEALPTIKIIIKPF
jgi:hypothetical protein